MISSTINAFSYLISMTQHMTFCRICYECWQFLPTPYRLLFNVMLKQLFLKRQDHLLWDFHQSQGHWDQPTLDLFSFLLISDTFLGHLSLVSPGRFDSSMHITCIEHSKFASVWWFHISTENSRIFCKLQHPHAWLVAIV